MTELNYAIMSINNYCTTYKIHAYWVVLMHLSLLLQAHTLRYKTIETKYHDPHDIGIFEYSHCIVCVYIRIIIYLKGNVVGW